MLQLLKVERIDHGVRCTEEHNIVQLFERGLLVTVNSDDPAYFGGHSNDNYKALHSSFGLSGRQLAQLAKNGFIASFLPEREKRRYLAEIDDVVREWRG